jgi:hypothetical protein
MGMQLSMWAMTAEQIAEMPHMDEPAAIALWTSAEVSIELWNHVSELFTAVGIDGNDLLFGNPIDGAEFFEIPPFAKDPNDVKRLAAKLAAIDEPQLIKAATAQTEPADTDYSDLFEGEVEPTFTVEAAKEIIGLFQRAAVADQHIVSLVVL